MVVVNIIMNYIHQRNNHHQVGEIFRNIFEGTRTNNKLNLVSKKELHCTSLMSRICMVNQIRRQKVLALKNKKGRLK